MIRLYDYWRSSSSYRVRIALGLAGLSWTTVWVNLLDGEHKSTTYLTNNPQGLVPTLEIDGHRLTQSLAIVEYLNETRALDLLPVDPSERAKVRALADAIAMEIHPVCNISVAKFAVSNAKGGLTNEAWMQHFIAKGLAAFEQMIDGGDQCFGASLTLADVCLVPQLYNARRWGVDLEAMPKILKVEAALRHHPAFAAAHPDTIKPG